MELTALSSTALNPNYKKPAMVKTIDYIQQGCFSIQTLDQDVRETLPQLVLELTEANKASSPKAYAVLIKPLFDFISTFTKTKAELQKIASLYREALFDLPDDLLRLAISETIKNHRYNTIPTPGDVRGHISSELVKRRVMLVKARAALGIKP